MELLNVEVSRNTIALDFDGVLHNLQGGWQGPEIFGEPVPGALEFVRWLLEQDYNVYVFSTRAAYRVGKIGIKDWLIDNGFPPLEITDRKAGGCLYIDDRGYRFEGDFTDVKNFLIENPKPGRWGFNDHSKE
jgi:hypothetical protein